jgi:hypothetical protein
MLPEDGGANALVKATPAHTIIKITNDKAAMSLWEIALEGQKK